MEEIIYYRTLCAQQFAVPYNMANPTRPRKPVRPTTPRVAYPREASFLVPWVGVDSALLALRETVALALALALLEAVAMPLDAAVDAAKALPLEAKSAAVSIFTAV
jgi:hypothetical protein